MKKIKIFTIFIIAVCLLPLMSLAQETTIADPLKEAHIQYQQLDWQTYNFYTQTNFEAEEIKSHRWIIDKEQVFYSSQIQYVFEPGEHVVDLLIVSKDDEKRIDQISLTVSFWSLANKKLVAILYGLLILIILYYWTVKLIYLINRRNIKKQTRQFLEILDAHGWVEKVVEHIVEKKQE